MGGPKKIGSANWKSKRWPEEARTLRVVLLDCELDEGIKWGKLCYSHEGKNIAIIQEMKAFLALMFFKGSLLKDTKGLLEKPGENSNSGRRFEFSGVDQIIQSRALIKEYIREAIEIGEAGLKVPKPGKLLFPAELKEKFRQNPAFRTAFNALTPGRQRGYNIYFSAPKGAEARARRIEKYTQKILDGRGFHDR